ncbi:hypothetical protein AB834_01510 [PVC group bacterium (ex Bugula neritina AB1)]|nr:hypothetical protein AB834_01510 [PVC group bacterium (ex Bugula neritina AB1)]
MKKSIFSIIFMQFFMAFFLYDYSISLAPATFSNSETMQNIFQDAPLSLVKQSPERIKKSKLKGFLFNKKFFMIALISIQIVIICFAGIFFCPKIFTEFLPINPLFFLILLVLFIVGYFLFVTFFLFAKSFLLQSDELRSSMNHRYKNHKHEKILKMFLIQASVFFVITMACVFVHIFITRNTLSLIGLSCLSLAFLFSSFPIIRFIYQKKLKKYWDKLVGKRQKNDPQESHKSNQVGFLEKNSSNPSESSMQDIANEGSHGEGVYRVANDSDTERKLIDFVKSLVEKEKELDFEELMKIDGAEDLESFLRENKVNDEKIVKFLNIFRKNFRELKNELEGSCTNISLKGSMDQETIQKLLELMIAVKNDTDELKDWARSLEETPRTSGDIFNKCLKICTCVSESLDLTQGFGASMIRGQLSLFIKNRDVIAQYFYRLLEKSS